MVHQTSPENWGLPGMAQDKQSVTRDWQLVHQRLISGVAVVETKNVPLSRGYLTEIYRGDWKLEPGTINQVFQTVLDPGAVSAWHAHAQTTDRLFVSSGQILIVLYDARRESQTYGQLNQFRFGTVRPALLTVPAGVWHGVQNSASTVSILLNLVDRAYHYEQPDHYRLPVDSQEIPFQFRPYNQDALRPSGVLSIDGSSSNRER